MLIFSLNQLHPFYLHIFKKFSCHYYKWKASFTCYKDNHKTKYIMITIKQQQKSPCSPHHRVTTIHKHHLVGRTTRVWRECVGNSGAGSTCDLCCCYQCLDDLWRRRRHPHHQHSQSPALGPTTSPMPGCGPQSTQ